LVSIPLLTLATTAGAQTSDEGLVNLATRVPARLAAIQTPSSESQTDVTLEDAIARALDRNLDIVVERLNPQSIQITQINRGIATIDLRQTMTNTVSAVQNAYWDLVHATKALAMQQQALELAETLVRDNEARVELGTMARIEVLGARSEAAARRQRLAEAQQALATAELALKQLIVGGTDDDYWTATLHPVDLPTQDVEPSEPEVAPQGLSPRIEAATAARELAEEQLAVEQGKFAAGTQTNFFVVQAQRDLAAARDIELRAILEHQKAIIELERTQRTSLSQAGISIVR
jgi:hypothetical protein